MVTGTCDLLMLAIGSVRFGSTGYPHRRRYDDTFGSGRLCRRSCGCRLSPGTHAQRGRFVAGTTTSIVPSNRTEVSNLIASAMLMIQTSKAK